MSIKTNMSKKHKTKVKYKDGETIHVKNGWAIIVDALNYVVNYADHSKFSEEEINVIKGYAFDIQDEGKAFDKEYDLD